MSIVQFLAEYGYLAVFAGSLFEGESVLLLAGLAAQQGYLSLTYVIAVAMCGATTGDQAFYFLGRFAGDRWIANRPTIRARADFLLTLLNRYDAMLIIGVRFMYGFRILGPIAIGASAVHPLRFLVFNALGAVLWAPLVAGAGYTFGYALRSMSPDIGRLEQIGALALLIVAVALGSRSGWWRGRTQAGPRASDPAPAPPRRGQE